MSTFSSNKLSKSIVVSACSSNVPWGQEGSDRSSCVADKTWSHSKIWTYFVFIWICFKTYIVLWFSCEKGSEKKEKYHAFIKILVINCKNWVSGCRSPDPLILLDMVGCQDQIIFSSKSFQEIIDLGLGLCISRFVDFPRFGRLSEANHVLIKKFQETANLGLGL